MRTALWIHAVGVLGGACLATPLVAQKHYPTISARQFVSGQVTITVSGAFSMNETVAINKQASIADGEMTWLQYGASGAVTPNALITFTDMGEVGVIVARGTVQGVAGIGGDEKPWCTGKVDVKPTLITGEYTCVGAASHDKATDKMGKVDIKVKFTAATG